MKLLHGAVKGLWRMLGDVDCHYFLIMESEERVVPAPYLGPSCTETRTGRDLGRESEVPQYQGGRRLPILYI